MTNKNKNTCSWPVIMKRELKAYFTSPVAYIVGALFLGFSGFMFFTPFFLMRRAELRGFFELLPILFSFFIPALTMRTFSEEHKSGTIAHHPFVHFVSTVFGNIKYKKRN